MKKEIKKFCEIFFEKLCINIDSLKIKEKENSVFFIHISSEDGDKLIGEQGKNIDNLQRIIQLCMNNKFEERVNIRLEINDYLKSKDERLYEFIDSKVKILLENGGEYMLPAYSPYERKKIHSYIANIEKGIKTKSRGKGINRRLYLISNSKNTIGNKKTSDTVHHKLTIDINGDNI